MTSDRKSKDDFRDYVGGVRPLRQRAQRIPPSKAISVRPLDPRSASRPGEAAFEHRDDGVLLEGSRPGAERKLRDLKRGRFAQLEALDLHGMTSEEAQRALQSFLGRQRGPRERPVLVVHGRGRHSPGGRGVLRDEIGGWLASSEHVLCFASARPEDGGGGAVYVLVAPRR